MHQFYRSFIPLRKKDRDHLRSMETAVIRRSFASFLLAASFIFLVAEIIAHAGVVEDAFITLRVADNAIHGYGLRWNIDERVQAYTHPLWLLLHVLPALVWDNLYAINILLSVACSCTAIAISLYSLGIGPFYLITLFLIPLIASPSFITFSADGLENPLSHLLFALFGWALLRAAPRKQWFWLSLFTSLAMVNRMDTVLLYAPVLLLLALLQKPRIRIGQCLAGALPFILWEAFSLLYYGFAFPNTKYAKLDTGLPLNEYIAQGISYFLNLLVMDYISAYILCMAIIITPLYALLRRRNDILAAVRSGIAMGLLLYSLYIVRVGGSYVTGLFWSLPIFASIWLLANHASFIPRKAALLFCLLALVTKLAYPSTNQLQAYCPRCFSGDIAPYSNWKIRLFDGKPIPQVNRDAPPRTEAFDNIGMAGYRAGPMVHIIDKQALSDALLARLPSINRHIDRIGHMWRHVPEGYIHALRTGSLDRMNPSLAAYYTRLRFIITGDLWDLKRMMEIVRFNRGDYDGLRDAYLKKPK